MLVLSLKVNPFMHNGWEGLLIGMKYQGFCLQCFILCHKSNDAFSRALASNVQCNSLFKTTEMRTENCEISISIYIFITCPIRTTFKFWHVNKLVSFRHSVVRKQSFDEQFADANNCQKTKFFVLLSFQNCQS